MLFQLYILPEYIWKEKEHNRPTQRAADKWESPRFLAVFNASAGFRFRAVAASRPLAANAGRWATRLAKHRNPFLALCCYSCFEIRNRFVSRFIG